jgi:anti-anti-sigma factor
MFTRTPVSRDEIRLTVSGALGADAAEELQRELEEIAAARWRTVSIDLSATESITSSSIGKLLAFRKRLAEEGRTLRITGCSEPLYRTFRMIQFDRLIPIER